MNPLFFSSKKTTKGIFPLLICLLILTYSCSPTQKVVKSEPEIPKVPEVKPPTKDEIAAIGGPASITLKNIKSIQPIILDGIKTPKYKNALIITKNTEDEEIIEFDTAPSDKTYQFDIEPNGFINANLRLSDRVIPFFLSANDNLTIRLNNEGQIDTTIFNNSGDDGALLYSSPDAMDYSYEKIVYLKSNQTDSDEASFKAFFQEKYQTDMAKRAYVLDSLREDEKIAAPIYYAMKKYAAIHPIFSGLNPEPPAWDDRALGLHAYRQIPELLITDYYKLDIWNFDGPGEGNMIRAYDDILRQRSTHQKSYDMMLRRILNLMGNFYPHLLMQSINRVPDRELQKIYKEEFYDKYMKDLTRYKVDNKYMNLVGLDRRTGVHTFDEILKKHRGKVVYVDLWASWCMPCRIQSEASLMLKDELASQPIVFLYLSTDDRYNEWITAVNEDRLYTNSMMILNPNYSDQYKSWNVHGIPRYLIFDKSGKLRVSNAQGPAKPETKRVLLRLAAER